VTDGGLGYRGSLPAGEGGSISSPGFRCRTRRLGQEAASQRYG
jgi:hypothetical protein